MQCDRAAERQQAAVRRTCAPPALEPRATSTPERSAARQAGMRPDGALQGRSECTAEPLALLADVPFDHTSTYSRAFVPREIPHGVNKAIGRHPWQPSGFPLSRDTTFRDSYVAHDRTHRREPAPQGQTVPIVHRAAQL